MSTFMPGSRWRSTVCTTQVVVVRAAVADVEVTCGGHPMVPVDDPTPIDQRSIGEAGDGTLLGKRYVDDERGLEVLCTQAGAGALAVEGEALLRKDAKPLPSSD
jgi:hypothetical protein